MDNFDHRSILVDSGSIVHCSIWHAYSGNEKNIFVIWNGNICKGLPCLKLSQAYLMKYWLGPTYLFKTTWTRKKCYALLHSVLTNNHGLIAVDGPWAVLYGLSLALCFHLIICGGEGVLICILIFIVVTCHMSSLSFCYVSLIISSGRLKYETM